MRVQEHTRLRRALIASTPMESILVPNQRKENSSVDYEAIRYILEDRIVTFTLNRPGRRSPS